MKEKAAALRESLKRNQTIIIFANCSVSYSGRAESFLPEGDRLLIIKEDKTVLIHQPRGNNPVNYMKPGTDIDLYEEEKSIKLKCYNLPLKEFLTIDINKIYSFITEKLEDGKKIELAGTEREMADMVYNNPLIISADFRPLSREEHTKYGFVDVFGYDKNNILTVIECKRYVGNLEAVSQLRRYVEKVKTSKGLKKVNGILACPKITPNAKKMLEDFGFKFVKVDPPKYLEKYNRCQKILGEF